MLAVEALGREDGKHGRICKGAIGEVFVPRRDFKPS
jgi:hypothetical protein